jgi:hypothetical protein
MHLTLVSSARAEIGAQEGHRRAFLQLKKQDMW